MYSPGNYRFLRNVTTPLSSVLLNKNDPDPVERAGAGNASRGALVCEHGGRAIPARLNKLGLADKLLEEHIAYDIGAEATARLLADRLQVPLLIQRYSRLLIDCNRPPAADDAMPAVIHGITVPGNQALDEQQRQQRIDEVFNPYDNAVAQLVDRPDCKWAFSIHSFTPELNGQTRPWDIGFLFRKDTDTSERLATHIKSRHPDINIGLNEPYTIDDESDWFVPRHAERLGLQHSLVEIRNDHITSREGQQFWAALLADAITEITAPPFTRMTTHDHNP